MKFYITVYKYYILLVVGNISLILRNILSKYAEHFVQNFIKTSPLIRLIFLKFSNLPKFSHKKKVAVARPLFGSLKLVSTGTSYRYSPRSHSMSLRCLIGFYRVIVILYNFLRNSAVIGPITKISYHHYGSKFNNMWRSENKASCQKINFWIFNFFNRLFHPLSHGIVKKLQKNLLDPPRVYSKWPKFWFCRRIIQK